MQTCAVKQMTLEHLARRLESHELLRGLPPKFIRTLAGYATETEFKPGQLIFREGESANCFYLILEGRVLLETRRDAGGPLAVDVIDAGRFIGWSWLFPPYHWHFSARAVEATKSIFFYGTWLRERCEEDPEFGFEILKRMAAVVVRRLEASQRVHPTSGAAIARIRTPSARLFGEGKVPNGTLGDANQFNDEPAQPRGQLRSPMRSAISAPLP